MKWEMGHEIIDELTLIRKVGAGPIWQVEKLDLKISIGYNPVGTV